MLNISDFLLNQLFGFKLCQIWLYFTNDGQTDTTMPVTAFNRADAW